MSKKLLILTSFIVLLPSILAYDLDNFPEPFVFEGRYNSLIVIGEVAKAEDVIAGSDILKILSKFENVTKPCQGWVECERRIGSSPMKLATEIRDLNNNLISVGGPCANQITAQIMDLPITWPDCANGFENGTGRLIVYNKWNKTQLIVAGYSSEDTKRTAEVLANYQKYNLSGNDTLIDQKLNAYRYCKDVIDCDFKNSEFCLNNKCLRCKTILNGKKTEKPGVVTCQAFPDLYINLETKECVYRGCGYSPYTSPGEGWIRID